LRQRILPRHSKSILDLWFSWYGAFLAQPTRKDR
jgi:hypothetical protein